MRPARRSGRGLWRQPTDLRAHPPLLNSEQSHPRAAEISANRVRVKSANFDSAPTVRASWPPGTAFAPFPSTASPDWPHVFGFQGISMRKLLLALAALGSVGAALTGYAEPSPSRGGTLNLVRSEERRGGKDCRSRGFAW